MTSLAWVEAKLHYFRTIRIGLSGRTEGAKLMTLQSQIKAKRVNELFSSAAGILPMSQVHMNISPNGPSGCGLPFIFASFTPFPTKIACINVNVHVINTITQNAQTKNEPTEQTTNLSECCRLLYVGDVLRLESAQNDVIDCDFFA